MDVLNKDGEKIGESKVLHISIEIEHPSNEEYDIQKLINMTTAYAAQILDECRIN